MNKTGIDTLRSRMNEIKPVRPFGRVIGVDGKYILIDGLNDVAKMGDQLKLEMRDGAYLGGEVLRIATDGVTMLPDDPLGGVALGNRVFLLSEALLCPDESWIGRVIDPYGDPLDGRSLQKGPVAMSVLSPPPNPASRRKLGERLDTGLALFNTMLPIVRGQRIGVFAGSGVGKTSLLGHFARQMDADVVVISLVGERGRELREFTEDVLGPEGLARSVVVTATSDRSPLVRRRCPAAATTVAEYFRDKGLQVLLVTDSITRFAEAHREVAVAGGELPALRGHPPSMSHAIMSLCERAGPGGQRQGDITAIYTVLVAGSDMDEPVADVLRGVLDGHVVLDRAIAERGRFPAVDVLRSVSRSLPTCATERENALISAARTYLSSFAGAETMIKAGLYAEGADLVVDQSKFIYDKLDAFIAQKELGNIQNSFEKLELLVREADGYRPTIRQAAAPRRPAGGVVPIER